jgi:DNA polymerase-3 subunit epsilon
MVSDKEKASFWARGLLERNDWVILDTETTGMSPTDEIVQMAILSPEGTVLLDTLIHPSQPIPASATAVHGITDSEVEDAPAFKEIYPEIKNIISGKTVIIYNAAFDLRILVQTARRYRLLPLFEHKEQVECAMLMYSAWVGEEWPYGGYKWQKLTGGDHTALGDCRATLEVIKKMGRLD